MFTVSLRLYESVLGSTCRSDLTSVPEMCHHLGFVNYSTY